MSKVNMLNKRGFLESLHGLNMRQLIRKWGEITFGESVDEYYLAEWINRYRERGYYAFISHMDSTSRQNWINIHSIWFELNTGIKES